MNEKKDDGFEPSKEDIEIAEQLIHKDYKQTSARYRLLCRLPEGMTALEALRRVNPKAAADLVQRLEEWAASSYMRVYSAYKEPENHITVSDGVFKAFKRLGGKVA